MASRTFKVLRSDPTDTVRRTLEDFPNFVEARAKLRSIAAEHDAADAALKAINDEIQVMDRSVGRAVDEAARARLENRQMPTRAALGRDRAERDFEVRALREALLRQADIVDALRAQCAAEIWRVEKPAHQAAMSRILDATIALADALAAEREMVADLARRGVSVADLPRDHAIATAIGSRRAWSSGVNRIGRMVSAYIGRTWDHSGIQS